MEQLTQNRNFLLFEGIVFILLGFVAVALPNIATLSSELFIGSLLTAAGMFQLYKSIKTYRTAGISSFFLGVLYLVFGLLLIFFPIAGILSLTFLLSLFFLIDGIMKITLGIRKSPFRRSGWFLLNGFFSLIIAYIIWAGWPQTAFWVLGLLVGINMIFFGLSLIFIAWSIPRIKHD